MALWVSPNGLYCSDFDSLTDTSNDLVKAVAAVNKNTIVVVHSVGPIILESILSNANVQAIVWAG